MARVPEPADPGPTDDYAGLPPVDSPEFELLAKACWGRPHGSPDPLAGRPIPIEYYRWL